MRVGRPKRRVGLNLGPVLYVFFSSPLSLPYVNCVSQEGFCFTQGPHSGPWTFRCSIFLGFSLLSLLATPFWTPFSFSTYLTHRNRKYMSGFQIFGREGNREWLLEMGADFLVGGWKCFATR